MGTLIAGLLLFLGLHSVRVFADDWRTAMVGRMGLLPWKASYALVSLIGFVLIVIGYGEARQQAVVLWTPPLALRHLAMLLDLIAFVLVVAAYVPRNALKLKLKHPMVLGVKVWALAHLLSKGTLPAVLLFGAFLLWAIIDFRSLRQRPVAPAFAVSANPLATAVTVLLGLVAGFAFARWGHLALIGVAPLG
ncbi:Uncharacterized membrane protein [Solimonas aquatica]|uniref:Uncharacterized membrane protein n=1 Tax=Solimonas aquatica TaxID=489703 RepID=A0A1H9JZH1_9GAMM|nr:NnrU family protein [Solimonas aquatica]SEQ92220.1 Uncharacterized membrane protein [Solimonas aquatica]